MSFLRRYKWYRRLCGGQWHYNESKWYYDTVIIRSEWSRHWYPTVTYVEGDFIPLFKSTTIITEEYGGYYNSLDSQMSIVVYDDRTIVYGTQPKIGFEPNKFFSKKFCMVDGVRKPQPWEGDPSWPL